MNKKFIFCILIIIVFLFILFYFSLSLAIHDARLFAAERHRVDLKNVRAQFDGFSINQWYIPSYKLKVISNTDDYVFHNTYYWSIIPWRFLRPSGP